MKKCENGIPRGPAPGMLYLLCMLLLLLQSACGPSVKLTASWNDSNEPPIQFSKILVLAIGKDLAKRRLAEDNIKAEMHKHGFNAIASLDEFGPDFVNSGDSALLRRKLLERQFDGVVTVRVLSIHEQDRWVPGNMYYGPTGFYHGFYLYYYRVYGYYEDPGYMVTDVDVLLESNLYDVPSGELIWSGQSKAFSNDPTPAMAALYARNIVGDMIRKKAIVASR